MGTRRPPASSKALTPEIQAKIDSIQREFSRLQGEAELANVQGTIGHIEERLAEFPTDLNDLKRRGFLHSRSLEERLQLLKTQWRKTSPGLRSSLKEHQNRLRADVNSTSRLVARARNGQQAALSSAKSAVDGLERKVDAAERALSSQYGNVDSELYVIDSDLSRIKWMMDALEESPEIRLKEGEGPLMAVASEWQRDGDEGPKGVLYLTNQRLLFEQKEEIVTKKRFGIFKAESEMMHKLWLDITVGDIASVEDSEEGGFLGIGKADILELTCSGQASISRARFHLKGQQSADWRSEIRRVQTGEVAAERHEQAQAIPRHTFPAQCPNCSAALPEPHRGATRITCEYCGSVIGPE